MHLAKNTFQTQFPTLFGVKKKKKRLSTQTFTSLNKRQLERNRISKRRYNWQNRVLNNIKSLWIID